MAKTRTVYACRECGHSASRWLGKCPACGAWDSFVEETARATNPGTANRSLRAANDHAGPQPVTAVSVEAGARRATGLPDLDRLLGGGLVPGGTILVGGEPGIGKSTLLLQVAHRLANTGPVLYVTAEESAAQLRLRAERLGCLSDNLLVLAENDLDTILAAGENSAAEVLVLDSIQMTHWPEMGSAPGSVGQVRECAAALIAQAKRRGAALFLVGHVTKDGMLAGPKVLEHMVDVVLSFEGDRFHAARVLRASKNRFGAANEIAVFEMEAEGLKPVADPSRLFLSGRRAETPGTVVTAPLSGTRPYLVEVQALVAPAPPGNARRRVSGVDANRAAMLLAVLEKRCDLVLADQDVFLNAVGGAELEEPGTDLALALAVAGSLRERTLAARTMAVGEVGLGGELRPVAQIGARLAEAARLGFTLALVPTGSPPGPKGLETRPLARLEDALGCLDA